MLFIFSTQKDTEYWSIHLKLMVLPYRPQLITLHCKLIDKFQYDVNRNLK